MHGPENVVGHTVDSEVIDADVLKVVFVWRQGRVELKEYVSLPTWLVVENRDHRVLVPVVEIYNFDIVDVFFLKDRLEEHNASKRDRAEDRLLPQLRNGESTGQVLCPEV